MGILDEAIREHMELKRQHGADDSELKQIEDQAFGPGERPGSEEASSEAAAGAPTTLMEQPKVDAGQAEPPSAPSDEARPTRREPAAGMADIQEPPERVEEPEPAAPEAADGEPEAAAPEPADEEQPAGEHEVPDAPTGPSTEERHAIADQPTEMYDVEEEFAPESSGETSDEELVAEASLAEPRLGPADPVAAPGTGEEDEDEDDDFFDEKRLSDELDQALEAPLEVEGEPAADEHDVDEHEVPDDDDFDEEEEPHEDQGSEGEHGDEDVLEETPDFLEEAPEDDQLWFEQKPPKDFDFDD
jgi:hypothetical protein